MEKQLRSTDLNFIILGTVFFCPLLYWEIKKIKKKKVNKRKTFLKI